MVYTYKILLDINKDLENRVVGCNKISYGTDWKNRIIDKYPEVVDYLQGKSIDQAKEYMTTFLEKKYDIEREDIIKILNLTNKNFNTFFIDACKSIEKITERPLYRNNFTVYLTTFPRGPYNYKEGSFLFCIYRNFQNIIGFFLHEILHLQFIHYFKENSYMKELNSVQFEMLKESLTIILNEEAKDLLFQEDKGYPLHAEFRNLLLECRKKDKNFDNLVLFGVKNIFNYSD